MPYLFNIVMHLDDYDKDIMIGRAKRAKCSSNNKSKCIPASHSDLHIDVLPNESLSSGPMM